MRDTRDTQVQSTRVVEKSAKKKSVSLKSFVVVSISHPFFTHTAATPYLFIKNKRIKKGLKRSIMMNAF
jgi:hypothetical protein